MDNNGLFMFSAMMSINMINYLSKLIYNIMSNVCVSFNEIVNFEKKLNVKISLKETHVTWWGKKHDWWKKYMLYKVKKDTW